VSISAQHVQVERAPAREEPASSVEETRDPSARRKPRVVSDADLFPIMVASVFFNVMQGYGRMTLQRLL
jgi:hypothetical protein